MNDIYAMQRANGDVFALDDHGRFHVPLFHSSRDAMIARSRNWEMLLFKPVVLETGLLKELVPSGEAKDVEFWLVNDPAVSLKRGRLVEHAQLALLIGDPMESQAVSRKRISFERPSLGTLSRSKSGATEAWEDEGGLYAKCA